jgi:hypothetical protein
MKDSSASIAARVSDGASWSSALLLAESAACRPCEVGARSRTFLSLSFRDCFADHEKWLKLLPSWLRLEDNHAARRSSEQEPYFKHAARLISIQTCGAERGAWS